MTLECFRVFSTGGGGIGATRFSRENLVAWIMGGRHDPWFVRVFSALCGRNKWVPNGLPIGLVHFSGIVDGDPGMYCLLHMCGQHSFKQQAGRGFQRPPHFGIASRMPITCRERSPLRPKPGLQAPPPRRSVPTPGMPRIGLPYVQPDDSRRAFKATPPHGLRSL